MSKSGYPKYKALPLEGAAAGWYVLISREDGQEERWFGFPTEAEARAWIGERIMKHGHAKDLKHG
jgi:hypothetical protein